MRKHQKSEVFERAHKRVALKTCPKCTSGLKKTEVKVHGAKRKAISYQCPECDYFEFDKKSSEEVLKELRETPLKIKQKIIKLSADRLGIYFNKDVIRCLNLKKGEDVYVSVPDEKHILLEIGDPIKARTHR